MTVRCARYRRVIGSMESYLYGGPDDEGHIHYRDPKYNENYGGEYDGDNYCEECFSEQLEKAELAGAEN